VLSVVPWSSGTKAHRIVSIFVFGRLIERNLPPPGGVSYLLCSLIKNREKEDSPQSTWYKFFEGGPLTHGSWWGNIVNRKAPRGGGFFQSRWQWLVLLTGSRANWSIGPGAHRIGSILLYWGCQWLCAFGWPLMHWCLMCVDVWVCVCVCVCACVCVCVCACVCVCVMWKMFINNRKS